jgi:hypothetical protein
MRKRCILRGLSNKEANLEAYNDSSVKTSLEINDVSPAVRPDDALNR